jgi:hypothetical protein
MSDDDAKPESGETPEQIAAEIRETRRELARTVDALVEKADVRRQARKTAVRTRLRLHDGVARTRLRVAALGAKLKPSRGSADPR